MNMEGSKIRIKSKLESKLMAEELRERLDRMDLEVRWKLEALDTIFSESEHDAERFHEMWIKPLLTAGLPIDTVFAVLIQGRFRPN
jgi:hypothetical protein